MSTGINVQLTDPQMEWLEQEAKQLNTSPAEVIAGRIEESRRESAFPYIDFRNTSAGREVYVRGTRLKIWHLRMYSDGDEADAPRIAADFHLSAAAAADALAYARTYADEIDAILAEIDHIAENIEEYAPGIDIFRVNASAS
ncbi:MAG: hypothetical protein M3439_06955 [Chloroflexota bacterium]|nr:hypothetical protein [Chloroflexota bacterium]